MSCTERNDIHLKVIGSIITHQQRVAEEFVEHFATLADVISGTAIERRSIEDFGDHPCVQRIQYENRNSTQTIEVESAT